MAQSNNAQALRIQSRSEMREKNTRRFFVFSLVLICVFFIVFMYLRFFNIKKIELVGIENGIYTSEEILDYSNVREGDNLINVRAKKLKADLERRFAYIKEAKIVKKFPSTLKIDFEFHVPSMATILGDDVFLLSSEGKVLGAISIDEKVPEGVCIVETPFVTECIQGERIVFEKSEYFDIMNEIYHQFEENGLNRQLTYLDITDKFNINASLEDRFEIVIGTHEELSAKVSLLAAVMKGDLWTDSSGIIDISDSSEAAVRLTGSVAN